MSTIMKLIRCFNYDVVEGNDADVVGVVTATAAVEAFYASVGVIPQNVNWAVKGAYASLLLPPTMEMNERPKSNPIANAKWSVVFIETE